MAALYAIWKRLRQVRLDGVNYDIGVKEGEDGRFSVAWVCMQCCEQGPPAPAAETLELAIEFAHIGLRAHHGFFHRDANYRSPVIGSPAPSCEIEQVNWDDFEHRHAAHTRTAEVFAKLCTAYERARLNSRQASQSDADYQSLSAACEEWNAAACEFREALEAYAKEVRKRADHSGNGELKNGRPKPR
jgi:hypothetical protein